MVTHTIILQYSSHGGLDQANRRSKHLKVVIERQSIAQLALAQIVLEVVVVGLREMVEL